MPTWTLAKKELRLLLRDRRALIILLLLPVVFILVLGLSLGEGFGQKPDDRLRVSIVDLDHGHGPAIAARLALLLRPGAARNPAALVALAEIGDRLQFPGEPWSQVVRKDLADTAGIRVEVIPSLDEAKRLLSEGRRSAVVVFGPNFSQQVHECSFLTTGINPFYRDGVDLRMLDAEVRRDEAQLAAASIIEQVAQVSLLRVILPWMIGRAFEKLSDPSFLSVMAAEAQIPRFLLTDQFKAQMGVGVKNALKNLFAKYNLTAKTWASLTKSEPPPEGDAAATTFVNEGGSGLLQRGAIRYQILVPSYTVMFAFFIVLTVGWLFVTDRRQGTLKRLRAAPLSDGQILMGKLVPVVVLSIGQGLFLLLAGKLIFGMKWGSEPFWLLAVVVVTSLAATGMAMLVATLARTETQVAIYGTLLVLTLAGVSGCLMPRELMPEQMKQISRVTPHAWALDAYTQLLLKPEPNTAVIGMACLVLLGFGIGFTMLAWWVLRAE